VCDRAARPDLEEEMLDGFETRLSDGDTLRLIAPIAGG
jgi:molybdopterin converting factor small subunit